MSLQEEVNTSEIDKHKMCRMYSLSVESNNKQHTIYNKQQAKQTIHNKQRTTNTKQQTTSKQTTSKQTPPKTSKHIHIIFKSFQVSVCSIHFNITLMAVKTTAGLAWDKRAVTRSVMLSASLGPVGS